jgi:hypothetical protein
MAEALRHALGICGDHWHPSLLNISAFFVAESKLIHTTGISLKSIIIRPHNKYNTSYKDVKLFS